MFFKGIDFSDIFKLILISIPLGLLVIVILHAKAHAADRFGTVLSNGLSAEYFGNYNLANLRFKRVDKRIDFDWKTSSPVSSVPNDNFSVRWKGQILAKHTGLHEFHIVSDDGVRFMIADTIIINRWNKKKVTDQKSKYYLEKGKKYPIILEYQEYRNNADIKLMWSLDGMLAEEVVPEENLIPKLADDGLLASYFEDDNYSEPLYTAVDESISFDWGKRDVFSASWIGMLEVPKSGSWEFFVQTDGNVEVMVNNKGIIVNRNDDTSSIKEYTGRENLYSNNKVSIRIKYSHKNPGAPAVLKLYWKNASIDKQEIPQKYLFVNDRVIGVRKSVMYVDASAKKGKLKHFWKAGAGTGHAGLYLRQDMLNHINDVKRNLDFGYLRFHGILSEQIGVYKKAGGQTVYDFGNIDKVYDRILETGMKPFVEFSYMPKDLASGTKTVFHYKANVTPPKDYNEWRTLIKTCVEHWKEKYGLDEIKKWRFEIWNEANLKDVFWTGTKEEYFKLYDYAVDGIKSVDPSLKVGGPATAGLGEWVSDFLEHCKTENFATGAKSSPVDFVSTHGYPWDKGKFYDRDKDLNYPDWKYFYFGIRELNNMVVNSGINGLEIHITEWGVFDYDKIRAASYLCHVLKDVSGYVDSFAFWTISDIFEELAAVQKNEFPGIYGLLNVHGFRKASYNAMLMLNMMGDELLTAKFSRPDMEDVEGWASGKKEDSSIQAMAWYFSHPNDPDKPSKKLAVKLRNIPFKKAKLRVMKIDRENGNLYRIWETMGRPFQFSRDDIVKIQKKTEIPVILNRDINIVNGKFDHELDMPKDSVFLIMLDPKQ